MVTILRKNGWELNPNDTLVNNIFKALEKREGHCPCQVKSKDSVCPCIEYRSNDKCHCNLYIQTVDLYLNID